MSESVRGRIRLLHSLASLLAKHHLNLPAGDRTLMNRNLLLMCLDHPRRQDLPRDPGSYCLSGCSLVYTYKTESLNLTIQLAPLSQ